jgi:assimilatory nitrate reductase catalytic subunit
VFVPMHWTDQYASAGRVDALVPGAVDPISGQPGLKQAAVAVRGLPVSWYGLAVTRNKPDAIGSEYWALSPVTGGWRTELAGLEALDTGQLLLQRLCAAAGDCANEFLAYHDRSSNQQRVALFDGEHLLGALYIASEPVIVSRSWAAEQLTATHTDRLRVLAGRGSAETTDRGSIVCACFAIGVNQIVNAIVKERATTVSAIGVAIQAGTNCGSCRAEIGKLIHEHADRQADAKAS